MRRVLAFTALSLSLALSVPAGAASIYNAGAGLSGNQTWGGTLGLDFRVNSPVQVTSLGAFDHGGDGILGHVKTTIFSSGGSVVAPIVDFSGALNPGGEAYIRQSVTPFTLNPGTYQLASWGYGAADPNYNTYGANPGPISFDILGGSLTGLGTRYSSPGDAGSLATLWDDGVTRYGAGTFDAIATGGPPPIPVGVTGHGVYDTAGVLGGNQSWGGTLGLDFNVLAPIRVTALGAFDSGADGIAGQLRTAIFRSDGTLVTPVASFSNLGNLTGRSYLFQKLAAPIVLNPGAYQLASWGYGDADRNFNTYGANPGPVTFDSLGGRLAAVGTRYGMPGDAGQLATLGDVGVTRYGAGSFLAGGVPEPATWAMMLAGFGLLGGLLRRQRRMASAVA